MPDSLPKQKKLISISEAAKVLGISIDTVRRWDKSGVLHSERPDGKNRYFSLDELEKHKSNQPLSISEAIKLLNISATTLRRLETRGLIKPNRNSAGERIFDRDLIADFLNSDYFLRKKQLKEETLKDHTIGKETQHLEKKQSLKNVKDYPLETPIEPSEEIPIDENLKSQRGIPEFFAATIVFLLLLALGIRNIYISTAASTNNPIADTSITNISTIDNLQLTPTPAVLAETTEVVTEEATKTATEAIIETATEEATKEATPKIILTVKVGDEPLDKSSIINIRQKPTTSSKKIGQAKDGDTLEFISLNLDWYEIKLADGSTGFISSKYIVIDERNN